MLKSDPVGYNAVPGNTGPFISLAVVASQISENLRNSPQIRTYSTSRSSSVIDPENIRL